MSYLYLTAIEDDSSIISCYTKGDQIKVDVGLKRSLPLPAINCTTNTSFSLKHLDHFDEQNGTTNTKEGDTSRPRLPAEVKEAQKPEEHAVSCNGCNIYPVKGTRYKCLQCSDYDLCATCQGKGEAVHNESHTMLYIPKPNQIVNEGYGCDGCGISPILGLRFNCSKCGNYDLCETCSQNPPEDHKSSHVLRICVDSVEEAKNTPTSERTVSSAKRILRKISEIGVEILDGVGQVVLDEVEKDTTQIIVADVDSVFDSS